MRSPSARTILMIFLLVSLVACTSNQRKETHAPVSEDALIIDVRTHQEFDAGHVTGAILIPFDVIGDHITDVAAEHEKEIVLYCRSGRRSGIAHRELQKMGYTNVRNAGGLAAAYELLTPKARED